VFGGGALAPLLARTTPVLPAVATSSGPSIAVPQAKTVRVGAKTFTEQYVLAALMESRLAAQGIAVERRDSLGSTVVFDALTKSEIDVYVDYSGTLWANAMKRDDVAPAWRVLAELSGWLAKTHGVRSLGALGFENAYVLAMRRDRAEALSIRSIDDLAPKAPELEIGSDYEFFQRPEWRRLREVYDLSFRAKVSFDSTFMYEALESRRVDVITAFSSDGRISAYDLVVLDDPRHAFPPYDALLLLSPRVASDARVVGALSPLVGAMSVERMRQANLMVDRDQDKKTPAEAAQWLWR
jgi:osmoprotectant transport system permease protein